MKEIYQVLSGAMGQQTRIDQIANNLANAETVGFKKDRGLFNDYLKAAQAAGVEITAPRNMPVVPNFGSPWTDFTPGQVINTGNNLDIRIEGEGFFEIEGADGASRMFTRAGDFRLNPSGEIATKNGLRLLDGSGGAIRVDPNATALEIQSDGKVLADGAEIARLHALIFDDPGVLTKTGDNLFRAPDGVEPAVNEEARFHQGQLEGSNVQPIDEMVEMIEAQRAHQVLQRVIQSIDEVTEARIQQAMS